MSDRPVSRVVIGIDVGGSKTHGVLDVAGRTVAESVRGAANPSSIGLAASTTELDRLLADLLGAAGPHRVDAVCAGAAGVDNDDAVQRLRGVLGALLPGATVDVVHDTALVLAAAGEREGIVVVSGTGSAAWGRRRDGRDARAGGWGYVLGDAGSGYGVVRSAVQHVLDRADDGAAPDPLTTRLLAAVGVRDTAGLLDRFYAVPSRRGWAAHAPLVFTLAEAGDAAAAAIVDGAAAELTLAVVRVSRRLQLRGPVVAAGGLVTRQPLLQATLRTGLAAAGLPDVRVLDRDPVAGAVALARAAAAELVVPVPP